LENVSPDLTRADESKLQVSGGLTIDSSGAEHYASISTFAESPHQPGIYWTGSDDGLVYTSRDGGKNWQNITPPNLPEWSYIFCIEVSVHDPETVFLSATRYKQTVDKTGVASTVTIQKLKSAGLSAKILLVLVCCTSVLKPEFL